jgi:hypothetical protein
MNFEKSSVEYHGKIYSADGKSNPISKEDA